MEPPNPSEKQEEGIVNTTDDNGGDAGEDADNHALTVVPNLFWPEPKIRLSAACHACPDGLLPSDAQMLPAHPPIEVREATINLDILSEASSKGLCALDAPAFLGVVPPGLLLEDSPRSWRLLLVVGPSGSGKTSLLRSLAKQMCPDSAEPLYPAATWAPGRPIIEQFERGFKEGQSWLCAVGLSSVPTWCKPFEVLSVGERYRANVARALSNMDPSGQRPLIFDEWTSELDRGVARSVCVSLRRRLDARCAAGQTTPTLLLATCHSDVEKYIRPDVLVECEAGQPPKVKYVSCNQTEPGQMLQAVVRGIPEPLPQGGWLLGRWQIRKESQAFSIRLESQHSRRLGLLMGKSKKGEKSLAVLRPPGQHPEATWRNGQRHDSVASPQSQCDPDATIDTWKPKDWMHCRLPGLGVEVRVRLLSCNQLDVQSREVQDHTSVLKDVNNLHLVTRIVGELAGQGRSHHSGGKAPKEKATTYKSQVFARLNRIEKHFKLKDRETDAVKKVPADRTPPQCKVVEQLQTRVAGKLAEGKQRLEKALNDAPKWGPLMQADRLSFLSPLSLLMRGEKNEEVQGQETEDAGDYECLRLERMHQAGWYVPADLDLSSLYPGLTVKRSVRCAQDFRLDPRKEDRPGELVHLASYVGEKDGSLSSSTDGSLTALEEAARFLDDGFSGLCVHIVPPMEGYSGCDPRSDVAASLARFNIGVILGPSGSGKSTLATERFGAPFRARWQEESSALAHFHSFKEAEPALAAAALGVTTAMRPAGLLSGGELERAALALGLADWAAGRLQTLVIDEFTSLVDRPTAHQIATGVAAFARNHGKRSGLVLLSCHADVVGKGLLEPDWVFQTKESRLVLLSPEAPRSESVVHSLEDLNSISSPKRRKLSTEGWQHVEPQAERWNVVAQKGVAYRNSPSFTDRSQGLGPGFGTVVEGSVIVGDDGMSYVRAAGGYIPLLNKAGAPILEKMEEYDKARDLKARGVGALERPAAPLAVVNSLELTVRRALPCEWRHFRDHHYKDHRLSMSGVCFVGLFEGKPVVFTACMNTGLTMDWMLGRFDEDKSQEMKRAINFPAPWGARQLMREHRTVVLPDCQGFGLGSLMADCVAHLCAEMDYAFMSTTAHPTYGGYRDRSPFWAALQSSQRQRPGFQCSTFSHVWLGAATPEGGIDEERLTQLRRRVSIEGLVTDEVAAALN